MKAVMLLVSLLATGVSCGPPKAVGPGTASTTVLPAHGDRPAGGAARLLLVVSAWVDCETLKPDPELAGRIQNETKKLVDTIEEVAADLRADNSLGANPSKGDVLRVLENTRAPVWLIYSGHARVEKGRSVICLPGGNLPIDDITAALPPGTAASFWFNACKTANVDVTRAETSAFAASPDEIGTDHRGTVTVGAMMEAVRDPAGAKLPTDANCDGWVTDEELFHAVRHHLPPYGDAPLKPKLRRQGWAEVPLYQVRGCRSGCSDLAASDLGRAARSPLSRRPASKGDGGIDLPTPPVHDSGPLGEDRVRYARPLVGSEHDSLIEGGYRACPCDEWSGHCYCRTSARLSGTAP